VTVNEVTTVGAAYALSGFMSDAAHVSTGAGNSSGLRNAFAAVNNLVNPAVGQARAVTPSGNGTVPQAKINTIANALHRCSVTAGGAAGDGSACGILFTNAGGTSVADTLQAALALAHQTAKESNASNALYDLAYADGPFQPSLDAAPVDWSLSLHFTGKDLNAPQGVTIDERGNVWIASSSGVTELDSTGAEFPGSPFAEAPSAISSQRTATDGSGRIWVANSASGDRAPLSSESTNRLASAGSAKSSLAVDASGNIWIAGGDEDSVSEFVGIATPATTASSFTGTKNEISERRP
jgi:hypothetical protein